MFPEEDLVLPKPLALPIGLIETYLLTEIEGVWNRFVWPFFIVYGFLLACDQEFWRALQRHRKSAIVLGILVTTLVIYDIAVRLTPPTRLLFGLRPGKAYDQGECWLKIKTPPWNSNARVSL